MKLLYLISIVLFISMNRSDALYQIGKCSQIPDMPSFDVNRYLGLWYEYQRLPNNFQFAVSCTQAFYGEFKDENNNIVPNKYSVYNSYVRKVFNVSFANNTVGGFAVPYDLNVPNKLNVRLFNAFYEGQQSNGTYNVVATDYDNYALVYNCEETDYYFFTLKYETGWILTRTRTLSDTLLNQALSKLASYTNVGALIVSDQIGC